MTVKPPYGPFGVVGGEVATGVIVQAGDTVRTESEGLVDFGGAVIGFGAPILNADGDSWSTPAGYPAPSLRKNSLICRVGPRWYQGGTSKSFTPAESGEVILRSNDATPEDNSRGWTVSVYHMPLGDQLDEPALQAPQPLGSQTQQSAQPIQQHADGCAAASCQCSCYYLVPPWWVTMPPWWVTMATQPPAVQPVAQNAAVHEAPRGPERPVLPDLPGGPIG